MLLQQVEPEGRVFFFFIDLKDSGWSEETDDSKASTVRKNIRNQKTSWCFCFIHTAVL